MLANEQDGKLEEAEMATSRVKREYKKGKLEIDMEIKKDKLQVALSHPVNSIITRAFVDLYKSVNPKNYLSMCMKYPEDNEEYEIVIQKKKGVTPAEKVAVLERDNAEILNCLKSVKKELDMINWMGQYKCPTLIAKVNEAIKKAEEK